MRRPFLTLAFSAALLLGLTASAAAAEFLTPDSVIADVGASSPTDTWCETLLVSCPADTQ
jgi:hypothetical protein